MTPFLPHRVMYDREKNEKEIKMNKSQIKEEEAAAEEQF